jgi:hypothetical protein
MMRIINGKMATVRACAAISAQAEDPIQSEGVMNEEARKYLETS